MLNPKVAQYPSRSAGGKGSSSQSSQSCQRSSGNCGK